MIPKRAMVQMGCAGNISLLYDLAGFLWHALLLKHLPCLHGVAVYAPSTEKPCPAPDGARYLQFRMHVLKI
jgi:hypothetical protein